MARLGGAMEKGVAIGRVHRWRVAGQAVMPAGRRTPPGGIRHISPHQGMHEDEAL